MSNKKAKCPICENTHRTDEGTQCCNVARLWKRIEKLQQDRERCDLCATLTPKTLITCDECADNAINAEVRAAIEAEREACAQLVSLASVKSPSPIDGLGGLNFDQMNETAQTAIHGACQSLAFAIRERSGK